MPKISIVAAFFLLFTSLSLFVNSNSAYCWTLIAQTNELFAVGTMEGENESYLFKIDPVSGQLTVIGDTGLNNCTGIDVTPDDKLKVFCELREGSELMTTNNDEEAVAVTAEVSRDDGMPLWAVPHGISNYISDITIDDKGVLFSYENLETDNFHRHELASDFQAMFIGEPEIDSNNVGIAAWGDSDIKAAANVDSQLWMFTIDTDTAETTPTMQLALAGFGLEAAENISTRAIAANIHVASMDSIKLVEAAGFGFGAVRNESGPYAFTEDQSEFAILLFTEDEVNEAIDSEARFIPLSTEIALIDADRGIIDYVVELQDEGFDISAIALRPLPPRAVPTLSGWGSVVIATFLFIGSLIYLKRRAKLG